eukprot:778099-Rhodomonas_salina.3
MPPKAMATPAAAGKGRGKKAAKPKEVDVLEALQALKAEREEREETNPILIKLKVSSEVSATVRSAVLAEPECWGRNEMSTGARAELRRRSRSPRRRWRQF